MTDLLDAPASISTVSAVDPTEVLDWTLTDAVHPSVWIARYQGAYVGMIEEREPEGFVALSRLGRSLGRFDNLLDAQAAFLKK